MKKIKCIGFWLFVFCNLQSQTYQTIQTKEEYDLFNKFIVDVSYYPCTKDPNDDISAFGDGMSKVLEGYITLYKITKDKAYLYRYMIQSICIIDNRHDLNGINSEPRWGCSNCCDNSECMYADGYIIAAMARFVYFIYEEDPELLEYQLFPFAEIEFRGITFTTLKDYTDWLRTQTEVTLNWFIANGFWDNNLGFKNKPSNLIAAPLNYQVGFARALLFLGYSGNGNPDYQFKANKIADLLLNNHVSFIDLCEGIQYETHVFRKDNVNNSYWWYHNGWRIPTAYCGLLGTEGPSYNLYTEFIEDISHGAVDTWLVMDYYDYLPGTPLITDDMIRFRNTFTKRIYDETSNVFRKAVNGQDSPVYPISSLDFAALNYMPLYKYDGADATAIEPNVYNVIMNFYITHVAGNTSLPASQYYEPGQSNKGHAEVVSAQWDKECVSLTLYNRHVVYDQDFTIKNILYVSPADATGDSYADPPISEKVFYNAPGISMTMTAGNAIELNPGFEGNHGFEAYIDPSLNCSMSLKSTVHGNRDISEGTNNKPVEQIMMPERMLKIYPNPNNGSFTVDVPGAENYSVYVYTLLGETILVKENTNLSKLQIDLKGNKAGTFIVKVITQESIWYEKVVAE